MNTSKIFGYTGFAILAACLHFDAAAVECIRPPETISRSYQAQFEVAAAKVLALRGPSLSGAVTSEAKNLLDKIPNADKTLIDLTYFFTICTALRDDKSIPEGEKAKRISDYSRALKVQPSKSAPTSNVVRSHAPATSFVGKNSKPEPASINISGNNAPVINNAHVNRDININTQNK